jgi:hypothetical protein
MLRGARVGQHGRGFPSAEGARARVTADREPTEAPDEFRPVGTLAFLAVYAIVLICLWLALYLTMLSRGGTG